MSYTEKFINKSFTFSVVVAPRES